MQIPGIQFIESYIGRQISRIDALRMDPAHKIALRIGAGILPAFVGSILLKPVAPFTTLAALYCLYLAAQPMQKGLFELTPGQRHTYIGAPTHLFFLLWAALVYFCGNVEQIGRTVGPLAVASAAALWPIYMSQKAYARKQRRVPFAAAYGLVAGGIILQQIAILSGEAL